MEIQVLLRDAKRQALKKPQLLKFYTWSGDCNKFFLNKITPWFHVNGRIRYIDFYNIVMCLYFERSV